MSDLTARKEWEVIKDLEIIGVTYLWSVDCDNIVEHKFKPIFSRKIKAMDHIITVEIWEDKEELRENENVVLCDNEYNTYFYLTDEKQNIVLDKFYSMEHGKIVIY